MRKGGDKENIIIKTWTGKIKIKKAREREGRWKRKETKDEEDIVGE